jgi:hypothetical protein
MPPGAAVVATTFDDMLLACLALTTQTSCMQRLLQPPSCGRMPLLQSPWHPTHELADSLYKGWERHCTLSPRSLHRKAGVFTTAHRAPHTGLVRSKSVCTKALGLLHTTRNTHIVLAQTYMSPCH